MTVCTQAANEVDTMNITDISGIGDATAQQMRTHGIDSVEAVAQASIEQLAAVPGIGAARAAALREAARRLLPDDEAGTEGSEAVPASAGDGATANGKDVKEKKDRKKEKKDKKKGMGKKRKKGKKDKKKGKKKDKGGKKKKNKGK